jgi:hypothetical protein
LILVFWQSFSNNYSINYKILLIKKLS